MTARTLVLLRHAKAERPGDDQPDFDRRLTAAGEADADAAGAWLADERIQPELVFCSPAARTRQTWHGVAVALEQARPGSKLPEVRYEKSLYEGGRTEVFDLLRTVPDSVRTVMVVGHNPTVSEVSLLLIPDAQWDGQEVGLKTAGLAVHRADHSWATTEPGSMRLIERHTARG
nr:histidine phosphatase family protein [uncultured Actinoplanes sp.]